MEARELYELSKQPTLAGRAANVLVSFYTKARPPSLSWSDSEPPLQERILTRYLGGRTRVLMLGSNVPREALGGLRAHDVTQIDIKPLPNVDVVADAERLTDTFPRESFDYVISTSMLEHTPHPWKVVESVFQVLRPGGMFYLSVPWMFPLHGEPHDYWRFSRHCLSSIIRDGGFTELDGGSEASPHHAMHRLAVAYLAEVFSRNSSVRFYAIEYAAQWLLFPLGLLERKLRLRERKDYYTDAILYIVAQKPAASV